VARIHSYVRHSKSTVFGCRCNDFLARWNRSGFAGAVAVDAETISDSSTRAFPMLKMKLRRALLLLA
jgi:hypothetical protein